jgi:hypothetical protein
MKEKAGEHILRKLVISKVQFQNKDLRPKNIGKIK